MVPPTAAPRSMKPPLPTSSSSGSSDSLSSTSSPDPQKLEYQLGEPHSAILSEAAAASAASQAVMAAAAAKFGLETGKGNTTSSSSSSTTSSRQRGKILCSKISVKLILPFLILYKTSEFLLGGVFITFVLILLLH